jgi:hypothetical protein
MSIPYPLRDPFKEHIDRAKFFLHLESRATSPEHKSYFIMAAVYPLQAAFELARGWQGRTENDPEKRKEYAVRFEEEAEKRVPYMLEVRTLRNIDFHHDPVSFTDAGAGISMQWKGRVRLTVSQPGQSAMMSPSQSGAMEITRISGKSGKREILAPKDDLNITNFSVFVDADRAWIDVRVLLNQFGEALENFVPDYFSKVQKGVTET